MDVLRNNVVTLGVEFPSPSQSFNKLLPRKLHFNSYGLVLVAGLLFRDVLGQIACRQLKPEHRNAEKAWESMHEN